MNRNRLALKKLAGVHAGVQAIEAVGTATTDDYHSVLAPVVAEACRPQGRLRLIYRFGPGFERITLGACGQTPDRQGQGLHRRHGCWARKPR
jgi:hypothetical protein